MVARALPLTPPWWLQTININESPRESEISAYSLFTDNVDSHSYSLFTGNVSSHSYSLFTDIVASHSYSLCTDIVASHSYSLFAHVLPMIL